MHPHRSSALGYASAASAAHSRVYGACAAEAAASETSGLSVGGCIRAWRYFGPYPVGRQEQHMADTNNVILRTVNFAGYLLRVKLVGIPGGHHSGLKFNS